MANTQNRGFASMDQDKQREIAAKGGASVPDEKRSFSKDHDLAAEAGRKGGENSHGSRQQSASGQSDRQQGERQQGDQSRSGGGQQSASGHDNRQQGGHRGGSGNFAEDRERASEAGRKGGQH